MKKTLSLLLAVAMAFSALTATTAFAAEPKTAKIAVSIYDGGFVLAPTELEVSADLSDKYEKSVGYNDTGDEPTVLDAVIAQSIALYGESFTKTAPFVISTDYGWASIVSVFKHDTSAIGYWLDGVSASGIEAPITGCRALEFCFYQDAAYWSDKYVNFGINSLTAASGEEITLTAYYDTYDENWNTVTKPAAGLDILIDGKKAGVTDSNGCITFKAGKKGAQAVTASGKLEGAEIFSPYCTVKVSSLATYVSKQMKGAAKYYIGSKTEFTVDDALDYLILMRSGYSVDKFKDGFLKSVKANLKKNKGKLISSYTNAEDIGLYGAVISILTELGYDPASFEGYNLDNAFKAVDLEKAVSSPYYYRYAIEAADGEFAATLCNDLIKRFYVKGKGLKNYGYSCDNTCYFLASIAMYQDSYKEYVKDAKAVIKSYTKKNGAYSDNKYVKTVNADSTALAMMAYASVGDVNTAYKYYRWLVNGFEGKTGVFLTDGKANSYATKESLLALEYFKALLCQADFEETDHKVTKTTVTKATVKKNGKIVKSCKICGKTVKKTVIYKPKKVKTSKAKYKYTGKKITPKVTVYNSKGKKIAKKYYTVKYKNNKKKGKATVIVKFKGNYKGTLKKTFKIV